MEAFKSGNARVGGVACAESPGLPCRARENTVQASPAHSPPPSAMVRKRVVEIEVESESSRIWWILAGTAAGVAIGVIAAERMSGRPLSGRSLLRKARRLARFASGKWAPLVEGVLEMRDAWAERRAAKASDDESDDVEDEEFDDDDEEHPIAARVLEAFVNDPVLAERAVEIDSDDRGNVFLHGRVRTSGEVAYAVTIAGGVPGVTAVRQRLRVRDRR